MTAARDVNLGCLMRPLQPLTLSFVVLCPSVSHRLKVNQRILDDIKELLLTLLGAIAHMFFFFKKKKTY